MKTIKNSESWLVVLLLLAAVFAVIRFYPHSASPIILGEEDFYHWFSWTGASYIAAATIVFYFLKRRYVKAYQKVMRFHILGNLLAFMAISMHFTFQIGSPPILSTYTHLGLTLYSSLVLQIIAGVLLRYQLGKKYIKSFRFVHVSLVTTFYTIIVVHVLHGLNII